MKKAWILACALLFVAVSGFAETAPPFPLTAEALAAILGQPVAGSSCATQAGPAQPTAKVVYASEGLDSTCTAQVTCPNGSVISCSGTTSTSTCTAVDRDCEGNLEPGHVTCTGPSTTVSCTPGCCTEGTLIQRACCRCNVTGDCFDCCRCGGGTLFQCSEACNP